MIRASWQGSSPIKIIFPRVVYTCMNTQSCTIFIMTSISRSYWYRKFQSGPAARSSYFNDIQLFIFSDETSRGLGFTCIGGKGCNSHHGWGTCRVGHLMSTKQLCRPHAGSGSGWEYWTYPRAIRGKLLDWTVRVKLKPGVRY